MKHVFYFRHNVAGSALRSSNASARGHGRQSLTDASAQPASVFIAVSPVRVLDTRAGAGGPIGVPSAAMLGPGAQFDLALAGDGAEVPAGASSVLINVTIDDDATLASYLTIWPKGEPQPFTSANNALPGSIAGNSMLAKLGDGGISIFNQRGNVNVVIDLVGYTVALSGVQQSGGRLLSGTAEPTSVLGNDGDYYIDTDDATLFGPGRDGAWSMPGVRLGGSAVGPSGPSGARGATGAAGAASAADATGPSGAVGPTATTGAVGPAGTAGAKILSGPIAPQSSDGVGGDLYVDTTTGTVSTRGAAVWAAGGSLRGPTGAPGATGLTGADGDLFLDVLTGTLYAKASGAWSSEGSLLGPPAPSV